MKLSTAAEKFLTDCRLRGLSASTITAYRSDLTLLTGLASIHAADSVLAFTENLVRTYMLQLSAKDLSMSTLHRRRASIGEFAKWGRRQRLWSEDPTENLPAIKRPKHLPRPFTVPEFEKIMALPLLLEEQVQRALLLYTGLRVTPICGIRWADVAFSATTLPSGLQCPGTIRATSKGRKTSMKPMHEELYALLRKLWMESPQDPKAFVFTQKNGRPWNRKMIERRTLQWGAAAGVQDCHPHRFRHSFATLILEATNGDIRLVQELMDHEDLSTTAIYTRVSNSKTAGAVMSLRSFGAAANNRPLTATGSAPQVDETRTDAASS